MRTDGQTDMMKLIVAFRNFTNAPKNEPQFYIKENDISLAPMLTDIIYTLLK